MILFPVAALSDAVHQEAHRRLRWARGRRIRGLGKVQDVAAEPRVFEAIQIAPVKWMPEGQRMVLRPPVPRQLQQCDQVGRMEQE